MIIFIILICSGGEVVDLYLKSAIEGVVIKWATQINDILNEDSAQAFGNGQNPVPSAGKVQRTTVSLTMYMMKMSYYLI